MNRFRLSLAALGLSFALVATGCADLRFDSEPETPPPASTTETVRQETAVALSSLEATAQEAASGAEGDVADRLGLIATSAGEYVTVLGGVWEAWSDGPPEGIDPNPELATDPVPDADAAAVVDLLVSNQSTLRTRVDTTVQDPDVVTVLASVIVRSAVDARQLADAADMDRPETDTSFPEAERADSMDGQTVLVMDRARFLYETLAARTDGDDREMALDRAGDLQVLIDRALEAGAPDNREPIYDWPADEEDTGILTEFIVPAEQALMEQWLFLAGNAPAEDRLWLVDAATLAAFRLTNAGGELPLLPAVP